MGWDEALKEAGEGYASRAGKSYLSHGHGAAAGFARGLGGLNKEGKARISESMSNNIATGAMGAVGVGGAAAVASNAQSSPVGAGIGGVAMAGALGAAMFMKPGAGAKAAGEALGDIGKAAGEVHGPPLPPAAAAAAGGASSGVSPMGGSKFAQGGGLNGIVNRSSPEETLQQKFTRQYAASAGEKPMSKGQALFERGRGAVNRAGKAIRDFSGIDKYKAGLAHDRASELAYGQRQAAASIGASTGNAGDRKIS